MAQPVRFEGIVLPYMRVPIADGPESPPSVQYSIDRQVVRTINQ